MGTEFQFSKMKRVLEMDGGDGHTIRVNLIPLNCALKMVKIGAPGGLSQLGICLWLRS